MNNSIKAVTIALLLTMLPAHGMFRGLTAKLGNAMRSTIGARLLAAQRPQMFNNFAQKARTFAQAAKNNFIKFRTPYALGLFGLGKLSFEEQVRQKEKAIKKEAIEQLKTLRFPVRITEHGTVTAKFEDINNLPYTEEHECNLEGFCRAVKVVPGEDKKSYSKTYTAMYGARTQPAKKTEKRKNFIKGLILHKHSSEYNKCLANYTQSQTDAQCKALYNIFKFEMDPDITHIEFKAEVAEGVQPMSQPIHRRTILTDGSQITEIPFDDAFIVV